MPQPLVSCSGVIAELRTRFRTIGHKPADSLQAAAAGCSTVLVTLLLGYYQSLRQDGCGGVVVGGQCGPQQELQAVQFQKHPQYPSTAQQGS
jgi:hypothetical protein